MQTPSLRDDSYNTHITFKCWNSCLWQLHLKTGNRETTLIQHVDAGLGLIVGLIVLLSPDHMLRDPAGGGPRQARQRSSAVNASVSTDTIGLSGDVVLITIYAESSATIETRDKTTESETCLCLDPAKLTEEGFRPSFSTPSLRDDSYNTHTYNDFLILHIDAGVGVLCVLMLICFIALLVAVRGNRSSAVKPVKASVFTDTTGLTGDVVLTIDAESSATTETRDQYTDTCLCLEPAKLTEEKSVGASFRPSFRPSFRLSFSA